MQTNKPELEVSKVINKGNLIEKTEKNTKENSTTHRMLELSDTSKIVSRKRKTEQGNKND